jgi:DNA-binding transcriptional LysR family regulator
MHKRIDWSDLQYVRALAGNRTLATAGRKLGVSHTTVLRRISRLEEEQGFRLFDRSSTGYVLTAAGEEVLAVAEAVASVVTDLERRLTGQDLRLEGLVRITTLDTLMATLLPPILRSFQKANPGVDLDIATSTAVANLTRRDADVAIRISTHPTQALIGRRVASVGMAIYGECPADVAGYSLADWAGLPWIGPSEVLAHTNIARWMQARVPQAVPVVRVDSLLAMAHAAQAGIGVAALPHYLGDAFPHLKRTALPAPQEAAAGLWVLTHRDIRRTARVRALTEHVSHELMRRRAEIEGGRPANAAIQR